MKKGVGGNLHDHPLCGVVYEATQPIPPGETNHAEVSMLWRSSDSLAGPDMQLMFIHVPFHPPTLASPPNSFTFGVATVPDSRGTIRLASADPAAAPLIDPNYLGTESDMRRMLDGVAVARELAATSAFDDKTGELVLVFSAESEVKGDWFEVALRLALGDFPAGSPANPWR